jgi:hypothetical protein
MGGIFSANRFWKAAAQLKLLNMKIAYNWEMVQFFTEIIV